MRSVELKDEVEAYIKACTTRITGVGAEQYELEDDLQKFEKMSLPALIEALQEELRDIANYACMLHIRLERLGDVLPQTTLL